MFPNFGVVFTSFLALAEDCQLPSTFNPETLQVALLLPRDIFAIQVRFVLVGDFKAISISPCLLLLSMVTSQLVSPVSPCSFPVAPGCFRILASIP